MSVNTDSTCVLVWLIKIQIIDYFFALTLFFRSIHIDINDHYWLSLKIDLYIDVLSSSSIIFLSLETVIKDVLQKVHFYIGSFRHDVILSL